MKTFAAIVVGILAGWGVSIAFAAPIDPMNPHVNTVTVASTITSGTDKTGVLDAGTGLINGQLQVSGPIRADTSTLTLGVLDAGYGLINGQLQVSGAVVGTTETLSGGGGLTAQLVASASSTLLDVAGFVADTAANVGVRISNRNALTAGMDRYIAGFYNDFGSTQRALIASNGTYINKATIGTAASGTGITASYSGAGPYWLHKVNVTNAALAAAGTSDVTLAITPANSRIVRVIADVTTTFTGGGLTAVTVTCGNSAGGNQYLLSNSFFTAQAVWGDAFSEVGAGLLTATWADFGTASAGTNGAITVQCRFTCTSANCSAATQGNVNFYVEGVTYF